MTKIPGTAFETETCSRCGGSGEYSYCEMYGKTCFKCHGKCVTFTKRAQIAHAWEQRQNLVPASTVQIGQRIKALGMTITVKTIEVSVSKRLVDGEWISCGLELRGQEHGMTVPANFEVKLIKSHADQVALRLQAIEYQNNLTKAGTPRKKAA